jgi:hypothetical protein
MERLHAHRALHLAANAVPILRHLKASGKTMTHKEFGQALGITRQAWKPEHGQAIADVLGIVRATFAKFDERLDCERIVRSTKDEGHWYQRKWVSTN